MAKYIDENGLLYLLQDLLARIKAKQDPITITETISSASTNSTVAGAKAVYDYVTSAIAGITKLTAQIVTTLPTTGESNILYLVPKSTAATNNAYDEYMWISNKWELIGTTAVDLSGYLKTTDIANWAKADNKPTYTASEVGAAAESHTHAQSQITDLVVSEADFDLASRIILIKVRDNADRITVNTESIAAAVAEYHAEFAVEEKTVSLSNSASYPFNNSKTTVALSPARVTQNYTVETEVTNADGNVGEVEITDKQLNGFKVAFTGSAKSVTLKIKIRGGIIA